MQDNSCLHTKYIDTSLAEFSTFSVPIHKKSSQGIIGCLISGLRRRHETRFEKRKRLREVSLDLGLPAEVEEGGGHQAKLLEYRRAKESAIKRPPI